jgi:hypothetical protein
MAVVLLLWKNGGHVYLEDCLAANCSLGTIDWRGCQIFLCTTYKNGEICIYQITPKYTKWSQNTQNGRKISQMS